MACYGAKGYKAARSWAKRLEHVSISLRDANSADLLGARTPDPGRDQPPIDGQAERSNWAPEPVPATKLRLPAVLLTLHPS